MNILTLAFEDAPISTLDALNVSLTGIVVVMIVLAILAVLVVLLSKGIRLVIKDNKTSVKTPENAKDEASVSEAVVQAVQKSSATTIPENQSMGSLDLYKTDEKTAAVIMAVISNESGIPLNRLNFKSIKLVEEQGGK